MGAETHLRTFILGSTGVTDLIGQRCHYNMIPQVSGFGHVWFQVVSDSEERTLDQTGGVHDATVNIECIGASEGASQAISAAIKSRVDGYKGAFGSITAQGMFLRDKDDDYIPFGIDSDSGAHVVAHELQVFYTT